MLFRFSWLFRLLLAVLFGAGAALALAPWYLWPLMVVGFSGLLWLLQGTAGSGRAFAHGWAFGVGYFLVGLHWIGHAFLVDAERFAWMMPFAVFGLAAGLALFPALAAALARRVSQPGPSRLLALALFWGLLEWLRGWLLTGFPWLLSGHVWAGGDVSLQANAYLGASGLGLLTVLAAAAPALFISRDRGLRKQGVVVNVLALALVGLVLVLAMLRWQGAAVDNHPGVRLRLVQAGIAQADKWRPELRDQHLALYLRLSLGPDKSGRPPNFTHLIWPETATPFFLDRDHERRRVIARSLPRDSLLITGSPRRADGRGNKPKLYNSVLTLASGGAVKALYDKQHLVPFGEYLPLRKVLAYLGLDKLAHGAVDFSSGGGPRVVSTPGLPPFRPLICYEIIFPREIFDTGNNSYPRWLLNLTNDAWFGDSFGPRQHLAIARIRAVELGLPVVRAANTGISAIIDPYGRIKAQLSLSAKGVIDSNLPIALPKTVYARLGDWIFALLCLLLAGLIIQVNRRQPAPTSMDL